MKKLTKNQIKAIAKIHTGTIAFYSDSEMFTQCEDIISIKDQLKVIEEIKKISAKLVGEHGRFGQTAGIVHHVIKTVK